MTMAWMATRRHEEAEAFATAADMARSLDDAMQRGMRHARDNMGDQRFRRDVTEDDFHLARADTVFAVHVANDWGETERTEKQRCARFWDWPDEPATEVAPAGCAGLSGIEVEETSSEQEMAERAADLIEWKKEGQTWWGAITPGA
jgi:hypothetical protein